MKPHYTQTYAGAQRDITALEIYDNLPIDERNKIMRQAKRLEGKLHMVGRYSAIETLYAVGQWMRENGYPK